MMVVAVAADVKVCVAPATPEPPEAVVVMVWLAKPLLGATLLNVNAPNPPLLIFVSVSFGAISLLLIVQVASWPATTETVLPTKVPELQLHEPAA